MAAPVGLQNDLYDEIEALPFMKASAPLATTLAVVYLAFVLKIGPAIMKNRRPLELRNVMLAYNAFQVVFSAALAIQGINYYYKYGIVPSKCYADDEEQRKTLFFDAWLYIMAKISELLDTVFFVLRKKSNQISFLHVYHHTAMMSCIWILFKHFPHDSYVFLGTFNSLVHVFMYAYYGLAAIPSMAKFLWWKKYLTTLQLIQFVTIFIHFQIAVYYSECPPSRAPILIVNINNFVVTYLFANFYIKSYIKNGGLDANKASTENIVQGNDGDSTAEKIK